MHFVTDRWQLCSFILEDLWFLHMRVDNQTWWQPDQYLVAAGETSFKMAENGQVLSEITRDRIGQIRPPGRLKAACWASSSQHPRQNHHAQLWLFGGLGAHDYEHDDDKMPKAESKEFALQHRFFRRREIGIMSDLWVYHAQRIEVADIPEESIEWTAAIALLVDKHESLITGNWERIGVFGDYPGRTPGVRTRASFGVSFGFSGAGLLLIMIVPLQMGAGRQPGLGWLTGPVLLRPATWATDGSLWMFGGVSCIRSLDEITCAGNDFAIFLRHFEALKQQEENMRSPVGIVLSPVRRRVTYLSHLCSLAGHGGAAATDNVGPTSGGAIGCCGTVDVSVPFISFSFRRTNVKEDAKTLNRYV